MFFVTDFESPPKSIFSRLKLSLFGVNPWVEYRNINGTVFGVVKGIPKGNRKFFYRIKSIVGNDPLILQNGFDISIKTRRNKPVYPSPPFTIPDPTEYHQRLLVNFALEVTKNAQKNNRIKVLLIDVGGNCTGVCIEFIKVAHEVTVLTNKPNQYDTCIRYTNQTFGTAPKLVDKNEKINDISIIIAPYGLCGYIPQNRNTPVFSIKSSDNGYSIFEDGIIIDNDIKKACPRGISKTLFASQMFIETDYSTKDLEVFLRKGNRCFTVEEIAETIYK